MWRTWVSTGKIARPMAKSITQLTVFGPTPGKDESVALTSASPEARSHSSGTPAAEKALHVADIAAFDAQEFGGRYHALRKRVPCRSKHLPG